MAFRPKAFGLTGEVRAKMATKYNLEMEQDALRWIQTVLNDHNLFEGINGEEAVHEKLKNGVILCKAMNVIQPGAIPKINESKLAFKMMENIGSFLIACQAYGVSPQDSFQTVDLYERQNMHNVILGINALSRKATKKGFRGPVLGPRESQQNVRQFSEEQLREGRTTIGLQMGSNKGANQSGLNFGKSRSIID